MFKRISTKKHDYYFSFIIILERDKKREIEIYALVKKKKNFFVFYCCYSIDYWLQQLCVAIAGWLIINFTYSTFLMSLRSSWWKQKEENTTTTIKN